MAQFMIVSESDYEVLKNYLGDGNVVLLPEHILKTFTPDVQERFREMQDDGYVGYDFGGTPDIALDVILSDKSYAYRESLGIRE